MTDLEIYRSTVLQIFGQENHKLVLTCRKIVYNEAKPYHVFDNYSVVDIEDKDHALNNTEKQKLLQIYGIEKLVEESSLERSNLMFPLNCYILFQNRDELLKSGAPKKVLDHRGYLLNELDTMSKSERTKVLYASLVFLMIANNNFTDEKLKNKEILNEIFIKCNIYDHLPHSREIREKLQFSENAYVIKTDFGFKFLHDSLFEIFAFHFGQDEDNQSLLLKHIDIEYLANNTYMGGLEEESSERDFQIRIFPNNYKILCNRLFHALQGIIQFELDVRSVNPILTHKCWSNEEFIRILLKTVGKKNIVDLFFKPYRVSKVKPKSRAPGKRSSWLHIQGLLENENYGQTGIPGVPDDGETRLIEWIVFKGHLEFIQSVLTRVFEIVKILVEKGANIEKCNIKNESPLFLAIKSGSEEIVHFFANARDDSSNTPLHIACYRGNTSIAKLLVKGGANLDVLNLRNESPISVAINNGSEELLQYFLLICPLQKFKDLLELCVSNDSISSDDSRPDVKNSEISDKFPASAGIAAKQGKMLQSLLQTCPVENFAILEEYGQSSFQSDDGKTPVHIATHLGCVDMVKSLIDCGVNINVTDNRNQTPLHIACALDDSKAVQLVETFIQNGANINATDSKN
ncbi:uncharacterized protein LOC134253884 [Saccostrea cucullata]|uniref:uncharacterized protein LOC134253884 n=1 Tax=Saccostrea cuccullata TaxID=36930 RepID=UPI002ED0BA44